jgi:hypothetical protein
MPSDQPGTQEDFELAAWAIWDGLPEQFRAALGNVTVHVADFADAETLKAMHISDAYDLLGLYHGMGLPFKSVSDPANLPDRIFLYRIPILSPPKPRANGPCHPPRADPRDRSPFWLLRRRHGPDRVPQITNSLRGKAARGRLRKAGRFPRVPAIGG